MPDETLKLTAGKPFSQVIRLKDVRNIWATVDLLEVRAQMRTGPASNYALISNLHNFMTWAFDGDDLVISWVMTGSQTRELYALKWGQFKLGYFNLVVSDVGSVDSRALPVPLITVEGLDSTTLAAGEL